MNEQHKNIRAAKATETLEIIKNGQYTAGTTSVELKESIAFSVNESLLYAPDEFTEMLNQTNTAAKELNSQTIISVEKKTVLEAASAMHAQGKKIGCLNFASARNPGGGFLGGALAQEESIAVSSALYPTLTKHLEMYSHNRAVHSYLYSDYMIFSPDVDVFRDDSLALLEKPYQMSIITSPAVNVSAIKANKPSELAMVKETMLRRMDKMFALFVHHNMEHLLLGAWGCGVFQNNPEDIAGYFAHYLIKGKYASSFKSVTFAISDKSKTSNNYNAFYNCLNQNL